MFQELTRSRSTECLSDLQLDAWSAEELDEKVTQELKAHVSGCERCAQRQHRMQREREAFLIERPAAAIARKASKVAKPMHGWARSGAALSLLAAAALLLVQLDQEPETKMATATRTKGSDQIGFFVKHGSQVREGHDGMVIAPGDSLRFVYSTSSPRYLAILSLDPKRKASVYFPAEPAASRVEAGQNLALPVSVELDETVGHEQLYAIFCDRTFPLSSYLQQLQNGDGSLKLGAGCGLHTLRVIKR